MMRQTFMGHSQVAIERLKARRVTATFALIAACWGGLLLLSPHMFATTPVLFRGMADWQPEWVWGSAISATAVVQLLLLMANRRLLLLLFEVIGAVLWALVAGALIYPNPLTFALIIYPAFMLIELGCAFALAKDG